VGTPRSLADRRDRLARWLGGEAGRAERELQTEPPSHFREHSGDLLAALHRAGPALRDRMEHAAAEPFSLTPVLRDVHREHVLLVGDRVTGLIDPAAALADSPAADLARLGSSLAPGRLAPLVAAYRTVRPLSEAEGRLADVLLDAGALLSGLAWVARGLWENRPDARGPAALARLSHFAAAADRLTA
jgi:Ser/Thr protein kinase RdoA (MazF antagonist)